MDAVSTPVRCARAGHRYPLFSLAYVVIDEANGGIIRNVNDQGAGIQAVGALRAHQIVRLRFDLQRPRVRVDAQARVVWSDPSGQCGVQFLDLPPRLVRQINEWIFGNLLESAGADSEKTHSMFANTYLRRELDGEGLIVSPGRQNVIQLEARDVQPRLLASLDTADELQEEQPENQAVAALDWLSEPLSSGTLVWMIDGLIMIAALLVFTLVFLSVAHEVPPWPLSLAAGLGAAIVVPGLYWTMFYVVGGPTVGHRLAELTETGELEQMEPGVRFR